MCLDAFLQENCCLPCLQDISPFQVSSGDNLRSAAHDGQHRHWRSHGGTQGPPPPPFGPGPVVRLVQNRRVVSNRSMGNASDFKVIEKTSYLFARPDFWAEHVDVPTPPYSRILATPLRVIVEDQSF